MISEKTIGSIIALAAKSDVARYNWDGRGTAPIGYVKGMAAVFAETYAELLAGDSAAKAMVVVVNGPGDVFDHYREQFNDAGMANSGAPDADRLRHLFVLLLGLGMRESSGRYCCGRDTTAVIPPSSDTVETGMFQQSWDSNGANKEIRKLYERYTATGDTGFLEVFKEGVTPRKGDLENVGSGQGAAFQKMCKASPAFAAKVAAVGLRTLYTHWGPVKRREVKLLPAADTLFKAVRAMVEAEVRAIVEADAKAAPSTVSPAHPWLDKIGDAFNDVFGHKDPTTKPAPAAPAKSDEFATRLVRAYVNRQFKMFTGPGELNVCYVTGMDIDGTPNGNPTDKWNDLRCVFGAEGGVPVMKGLWVATTEPGFYYGRDHIINPKGPAHLEFGQYDAWEVGYHRGDRDRLAWIQTGGEVTVWRDRNKNFQHDGADILDTGWFGINQHDGQDGDQDSVGPHSAGCLVVRSRKQHSEFMALTMADPRIKATRKFVLTTAILPASEV